MTTPDITDPLDQCLNSHPHLEPVPFCADIIIRNLDSTVNPHLLSLVTCGYVVTSPVFIGAKVRLNVIEDLNSPTNNAFPRDYYNFVGKILGATRVGGCSVDLLALGIWRGAVELVTISSRLQWVSGIDTQAILQEESAAEHTMWLKEEEICQHMQETEIKLRDGDRIRFLAACSTISELKALECQIGLNWKALDAMVSPVC